MFQIDRWWVVVSSLLKQNYESFTYFCWLKKNTKLWILKSARIATTYSSHFTFPRKATNKVERVTKTSGQIKLLVAFEIHSISSVSGIEAEFSL